MNNIIGIKYTHDSAVARIDGDTLVYSIEMEKINGNPRHKEVKDVDKRERKFISDKFDLYADTVVDGWHREIDMLGCKPSSYGESDSESRVWSRKDEFGFVSYPHVLGHIIGAYASWESAEHKIPACVIVWDGCEVPTVYIVNPQHEAEVNRVRLHSRLLPFSGIIYGMIGVYFGPYKGQRVKGQIYPHLSVAGKLMSYAGLGNYCEDHIQKLMSEYRMIEKYILWSNVYMVHGKKGELEDFMMQSLAPHLSDLSDQDAVATMHEFLERLFIRAAMDNIPADMPLIFTGGCALNIKWNTALLETNHFSSVWIPPFCNDSGSAIGQACAHNAFVHDIWHMKWSVYSGPEIIEDYEGEHKYMTPYNFGKWLAMGDIAIVLEGKAEIGPRALGHRSLMADPRDEHMKEKLNVIKKRESFRPVAPICLSSDAVKYFELVTKDKYMLFDHKINKLGWDYLPAIQHEDRTARVQIASDQFTKDMLEGFKDETGVGILCNTSANGNGKGFFSSVSEAVEWAKLNGVHYVYCNTKLYEV